MSDERDDHAVLIGRCRRKADLYRPNEVDFLKSAGEKIAAGRQLSTRQAEWLAALAEKEVLDFEAINAAALAVLETICIRWLSDGRTQGNEYIARNPRRADGNPGSFRINLNTGRWADFALSDARGGDAISLAAYLFHDGDQAAAARDMKRMVGL